jgi:hypothetical protein
VLAAVDAIEQATILWPDTLGDVETGYGFEAGDDSGGDTAGKASLLVQEAIDPVADCGTV